VRTMGFVHHAGSRGRRAALVAAVGACGLALSACGGGTSVGGGGGGGGDEGGDAAVVDGTGEVGGEIRLAYWGAGARVELTDGVAALFAEANPGVTVQSEFADFAAYWERLNVQASSGNLACVTQTQGRQLNDYSTKGVLLDLDPMVESGAIDVSDIPEEVLDTGRGLDGKLYMVPYGAAYDGVTINATLAEQAGVGLPEEGYGWDDLGTYLTEAQAGLPQGVAAADLGGGRPNWFIAWVRGQGEELFDGSEVAFDEQTLVDFWTFWEDLRAAGATNTAEQHAEQPVQSEQRYVAQGSAMLDSLPGNALTPAQATLDGLAPGQQLTTVPMPSGEAGSGNVLFTSGFSIPVNCDNVPTAAAFIDFWTNDDEGAALFASNNGGALNTAHLQAQLDNPDLPELKRHELELFQDIVANDPPSVVYPPGYQANFELGFTRAYDSIALGGTSVEDAAAAFIAELSAALEASA